jgi:hypothetical protein
MSTSWINTEQLLSGKQQRQLADETIFTEHLLRLAVWEPGKEVDQYVTQIDGYELTIWKEATTVKWTMTHPYTV